MSDFPMKRLCDVGVSLLDCVHATPKPAESSEYVYVAIPDLKDGHIDLANARRITLEDFGQWTRKTKPQAGDIIMTRRGRVGDTAVIPASLKCAIGQNLVILRSDASKVDQQFLRWALRGPLYEAEVRKYLNVGAVFDSLNCRDIPLFEIPVPPISVQTRIAHILGTLDDKIELNRRMNRTLEAIARAIFKSWFIDFLPVRAKIAARTQTGDPVCAKADDREPVGMDPETAALFPDSFQDSPLGKIPEGWEVGHLADHIGFALGGDWGKDAPDGTHTESAYCIRGTDLPTLQQGQLPELRLRYLKPSSLERRLLRSFDLVFEVSGGSPTQSTGRSLLVNESLLSSYDHPLVCTNFCRLVRFTSERTALFASFVLDRLYSIGGFFAHETGTTTIKNFAFKRFVEDFEVVFPDRQVLSAFAQTIGPSLASHSQNGVQSDSLSKIRDTLLPPLLSGRIAGPCDGTQGGNE